MLTPVVSGNLLNARAIAFGADNPPASHELVQPPAPITSTFLPDERLRRLVVGDGSLGDGLQGWGSPILLGDEQLGVEAGHANHGLRNCAAEFPAEVYIFLLPSGGVLE